MKARRALSIFKAVPLRTRGALSLYNAYGDSALVVLNGSSFNSDSALLALNWRYMWIRNSAGQTLIPTSLSHIRGCMSSVIKCGSLALKPPHRFMKVQPIYIASDTDVNTICTNPSTHTHRQPSINHQSCTVHTCNSFSIDMHRRSLGRFFSADDGTEKYCQFATWDGLRHLISQMIYCGVKRDGRHAKWDVH